MNDLYNFLSKKLKHVIEKQQEVKVEKERSQAPEKGISGVVYIEGLIDHKLLKRSNSAKKPVKRIMELELKVEELKTKMMNQNEEQLTVNKQQKKINELHIVEVR